MASLEDDYRLLGLNAGASREDISSAWRELALSTHPDKVLDPEAKKRAERRFALMNEAYHRVIAAWPLAEGEVPALEPAAEAPAPAPAPAVSGGRRWGALLLIAAIGAGIYVGQRGRDASERRAARSFWEGMLKGFHEGKEGLEGSREAHSLNGDFRLDFGVGYQAATMAIQMERSRLTGPAATLPPVGIDVGRGSLTGLVVSRPGKEGGLPRYELHELPLNRSGKTRRVVLRPGTATASLLVAIFEEGPDPAFVLVEPVSYTIAGAKLRREGAPPR